VKTQLVAAKAQLTSVTALKDSLSGQLATANSKIAVAKAALN
jgi:hypothetical protein